MDREITFEGNNRSESRPHGFDWAIGRLADKQHRLVRHDQLLAIGLSTDQIRYRVKIGRLRVLYRRVYAVGHDSLAREGRWLAAVYATRAVAALSNRAAGHNLGLVSPGSYPIEVTSPIRRHSPTGFLLHFRPLPADEVVVVDGIPTTSVARTQLDLAADLDDRRLARTFEVVEARQLYGPLSIQDLLERYPRVRGRRRLERVMRTRAFGQGITKLQLEEAFQDFLTLYPSLPSPDLNVAMQLDERWVEIDGLWRRQNVALELDSRRFHDNADAFQRDRAKDRLLTIHGFRPARATWIDVTVEHRRLYADLSRILELTNS